MHEHAKQVVVIRDLDSNFIEEAIFILKNNISELKNHEKRAIIKRNLRNSDYIIKEAQSIIDNYIKQQAMKYECAVSMSQYKKNKSKDLLKWNISVGTVLNIAMFISIALFVFLLSRVI